MVELPLNGRNFIQLAQLSAGAMPIGIGVSPASTWTGRSDTTLSIAGGRESNNSFLVNGIETRNARFGNAGIRPSIDAIQEVKIQRSTFGAEFGRSAAIINTTIKSGTNQLHGSVFEFNRDEKFDANDFFLNRTDRAKPPFKQNNFGTAVGGPLTVPCAVRRPEPDVLVLQLRRVPAGTCTSSATGLYPSAAQLRGNLADDSAGTGLFPTSSAFCQANAAIAQVRGRDRSTRPASRSPATSSRRAGSIPTTQLATQYTVTPNVTVPAGAATFPSFNAIATPPTVNNFDQYNVRLDHHARTARSAVRHVLVRRRGARRQGAAPVRRRRVSAQQPAGDHHARAHVHAEPAERVPLRLQPQQDVPAGGDLLRAGLRARGVQPQEHHRPGDHVRDSRVQHDRVRRHRLDLAGDRRARREPAVHRQPQPRQGQSQRARRVPDQPAGLFPDHELQRQSDVHVRRPLHRPAGERHRARRLPARRVPRGPAAPSATRSRTCARPTGPATCRTTGASCRT